MDAGSVLKLNYTSRTGYNFRHRGTGGQLIRGTWMAADTAAVLASCPAGFACFNLTCPLAHFLTQHKNLWVTDEAGRFMSVTFDAASPYGTNCPLHKKCTALWSPLHEHACSEGGDVDKLRAEAAQLRQKSARLLELAAVKDAEADAALVASTHLPPPADPNTQ